MAGDEESWITPAMRAAIGQESDPSYITLTPDAVRKIALAIEFDDPEFLAALDTNPELEVPHWALFVRYTSTHFGRIPDVPGNGLIAGDEMEMFAPVHIGDRLTLNARVADIQERIGGRVGHSLFVHHEWDYINQDGIKVARARRTLAMFQGPHRDDAAAARG